MQLQPFLEAYGFGAVLPVFFPRLVTHSQAELERIGRFLGHEGPLRWDEGLGPQNQGTERLRPSPVREVLVQAPVLTTIRQRVVPRRWSRSLKELWRARVEPPRLSPVLEARLREVFDADLAQLGSWLGVHARLRQLPRGDRRPRARVGRASTRAAPAVGGGSCRPRRSRAGSAYRRPGTPCAAGRRSSC